VVGTFVLRERLRECLGVGGISSGSSGVGVGGSTDISVGVGGGTRGGGAGVAVGPDSISGHEAGKPLESLIASQAEAFAASCSSEKGTGLI
jgi:hypothetical protein